MRSFAGPAVATPDGVSSGADAIEAEAGWQGTTALPIETSNERTFGFPQGPLDARAAHFVRHAVLAALHGWVRIRHGEPFALCNRGPNLLALC
jgi:hypothetical protein